MEKPFSVSLWESHPDSDNDDCDTGLDFATLEEARECFANIEAHFNMRYYRNTPFVMLDGPGVNEIMQRCAVNVRRDSGSWKREIAMQAGMAGGCEAHNDEMGY